MTPAILLIIFKRTETTVKVFEAIRQARPARLFIAADGPRSDRIGEVEACQRTREAVASVDWPCEVQRLYRERNVGCRLGISEAITWFLAEAGEGIILEDDCLPSPEFFPFAAALLDKYRHDDRVMHINGSNFHQGRRWSDHGYYFSRYNHGWGWATWKRAWDHFSLDLSGLEAFLVDADRNRFWDSNKERRYWTKTLRQARDLVVDAWDYQWNYALWARDGLCLYPERNLISNIGFGEGATNTTETGDGKGFLATEALGQWSHPTFSIRNRPADRANFLKMFWGSPWERWTGRLKKLARMLRI